MGANDYIIITSSQDLNEDQKADEGMTKEEEDSSRHTLEAQGIFLDPEDMGPTPTGTHDEFSKQLQEIGGIEIIPTENEDTSY